MKQKHILKWLGIALGAYLLYAVLTAVFVPLPQKEAAGKLWSQYEARLSTDASQERAPQAAGRTFAAQDALP